MLYCMFSYILPISFLTLLYRFRKDELFHQLKKNIKGATVNKGSENSQNRQNDSYTSISSSVSSAAADEATKETKLSVSSNPCANLSFPSTDDTEKKPDYGVHPMVLALSSRGLTSAGAKRKLQATVREELTRTLSKPLSPSSVATTSLSPSSSASTTLKNAGKQVLGI
jgi:hypothetical protein